MKCHDCYFYHYHRDFPKQINTMIVHSGDSICKHEKKARRIGKRELKRDSRAIWCPLDPCHTVCIDCGDVRRINSEGTCVTCYKKANRTDNGWTEQTDTS